MYDIYKHLQADYLVKYRVVSGSCATIMFIKSIYTIRFVAYNSYFGVWKRTLMSDFYSSVDGEILRVFTDHIYQSKNRLRQVASCMSRHLMFKL